MNQREFESLFYPYQHKIYLYALCITKDYFYAEDITQDVFMKLWLIRDRLEQEGNLEGLAMKITKNLSLNLLRKNEKINHGSPGEAGKVQTPLDQLRLKETQEKIELLIDQLPQVQRELIHLKDKEGFSLDEIEMITGYDKNYISVNLSRARKKLKEMYDKMIRYGE